MSPLRRNGPADGGDGGQRELGDGGPAWLRTAALWLVVPLCALLGAVVPLLPDGWYVWQFHALPPPAVLVAGAAFAAVAVATRGQRRRLVPHVLLAAAMVPAYVRIAVQPLGDCGIWSDQVRHDRVSLSEPLANVIFRLAYRAFGDLGVDAVAPVCGFGFALGFLHFCEVRFVAAAPRRAADVRLLCAAVLWLSGWQLFFFRGYFENTFLGLVCLLPALRHACDYARRGGTGGVIGLVRAAAWLALASTVHGVHSAMLPLLAACAVLRWPPWRHGRRCAGHLGAALGTFAGVVGSVLLAIRLAGFELVAGNVRGGSDDGYLLPLDPDQGSIHYAFGLLSFEHAAAVGNALLMSSPLIVCLPLLLSTRARTAALASVRTRPALAIAGAGSLAFTCLFYFELLFPGDYDLQLSALVPLDLCLLQLMTALPRRLRGARAALLALGGAYVWIGMSAMLVHPDDAQPFGARGGGDCDAARALTVNGYATEVRLRRGEWVRFALTRPPVCAAPARFSLHAYRGVPTTRATIDASASMSPADWDAERRLLIADAAGGGLIGEPMPLLVDRLIGPALPVGDVRETLTLQARIVDANGREWSTNAVVVHVPGR